MKLIASFSFVILAAAISVSGSAFAAHGDPSFGGLSFTTLVTSDRSPTISGTVSTQCESMMIRIFDQGTGISAPALIEATAENGYTVDGTGHWSLDLSVAGHVLDNQYYDIDLDAVCGAGTSRSIFYNALKIQPAACDASCVPVHRFYDFTEGVHFYTADEAEKDQLFIASDFYRYEGVSSFARNAPAGGLTPVHRFYNFKQGVHFYTANQAEATNVNDTAFHTFRYEGVAYYTNATQVTDTTAVYRFYNFKYGVHFYTSNQAEADHVTATAAHTYRYEGVTNYNIENK